MIKILDKLGIAWNFFNLIKYIYKKLMVNIMSNGEMFLKPLGNQERYEDAGSPFYAT